MLEAGKTNDIKIVRGDGLELSFAFFSDSALTEALNLSDYSEVHMDVRKGPASDYDTLLTGSIATGEISKTDNRIDIDLGAFDQPGGRYYFDIRFKETGNDPQTALHGTIICKENITEL